MSEWKTVEGSIPSLGGTSLMQDPSRPGVLHFGTSFGYLRSDDGGKSVRRICMSLEKEPLPLLSLVVCRTAPKRLYGVMPGGRIVLSEDDGVRWRRTAMRGIEEHEGQAALVGDPSDAGKLYLICERPSSLCFSPDAGESWQRQTRGFPEVMLVGDAYCGAPLAVTRNGLKCAALEDGRVVRIAPGQDSWRILGRREIGTRYAASLCADPHRPSRLWRTARGRLWRSDDGLRWTKLGPDAANFVVCDHGRPGRMALLRQYGRVALSNDAGVTWRNLEPIGQNLGLAAFAGNSLVVMPDYFLLRRAL